MVKHAARRVVGDGWGGPAVTNDDLGRAGLPCSPRSVDVVWWSAAGCAVQEMTLSVGDVTAARLSPPSACRKDPAHG